jgi:hypothetical protein
MRAKAKWRPEVYLMVEIAIEDARVNLMLDQHMAIVKVCLMNILPDLNIVVFDFILFLQVVRMKTDQRL